MSKRARGSSPHSGGQGGQHYSSSLPPSSPPPFAEGNFSDEEEDEALLDDEDHDVADGINAINFDVDEEDEEDGIDLFGPQMLERDYKERLNLDHYEAEDIDDEGDFDAMDPAARRQLEAKLRKRDRELERQRALARPGAFIQDDSDDEGMAFATRRRRRHFDEDADMMDEAGDMVPEELSLEAIADVKAESMSEWINTPAVRRTIASEFKSFLLEYTDDHGTSVYGQRIKSMGLRNEESLDIGYGHLAETKAILAYFLANCPSEMLAIFDKVALDVTLLHYPAYERIHLEIHTRVADLPTLFTLRDLRQQHLNCLVRVTGVVTRRTGVFPQLKYVKFTCGKCKASLGPFKQDSNAEVKINFCFSCQSRGPFTVDSEQTVYRNYQKMTLQESPGTVPPGRLPRHREVILLWDLIDSAKPGEEVEVTGIYKNCFDPSLNTKNGFPVFATVIEANWVVKSHDDLAAFRLTEEDEKLMRRMSREDNITEQIIQSIAPSIFGHDDIKTAIAMSLFGGVPKDINGKHSIRGDINVLLLGDPGTAKSQFLKYVEKTAHRAVFTTGQGASAVGLTASVHKDTVTGEWTLEGGALVLADKGTCLIDEFDKMNDQDRTSIHEAMEQQSISISKAGIVTSLQARCAVLAAANPVGGRYNSTVPFSQNVQLTEPILSRFDILCVVRDVVDPAVDQQLAEFVVASHARSHPDASNTASSTSLSRTSIDRRAAGPIAQDVLRKYILYARNSVRPKLHSIDQEKISQLYSDLRRESLATGSFPITVRHLESILRLAEAHAKMRLNEFVNKADIDAAIGVTIASFVGSQKLSVRRSLERKFAKYTLSVRH